MRVAFPALIPPSAKTGSGAVRTIVRNARAPIGRPALGPALSNTGERMAASTPSRAARAMAALEWAEAVSIQCWLRRRTPDSFASGQWTPSAPMARARSASAETSNTRRLNRQMRARRLPASCLSNAPKCRKITPKPAGRRAATSSGCGVRLGSVMNHARGRVRPLPARAGFAMRVAARSLRRAAAWA